MKKRFKGLSPVIATVLLITIVIIIALIVFLWIRGMTEEAITKFGNQNIQLVCGQVVFEASYNQNAGLAIRNPGTVPIFGMNVKVVAEGSHQTLDLRDNPNWPTIGLNTGGAFSDPAFSQEGLLLNANEIVLVPVLIGESESGRKTYACDEGQYGYPITII
jgi:FlaG/FlaF family flagellin (archaellin)